MIPDPPFSGWQRAVFVLGGLTLAIFILSTAQKVLIPLVLAALFAFILTPPVAALQRRGLKRTPAVLLVVSLALVLLGAIGWAVTVQVQALARELPQHKHTIIEKLERLRGASEGGIGSVVQMVQEIADSLRYGSANAGENSAEQKVVVSTESASPWGTVTVVAGPLLEGLATTVLVVVLVIFVLILRENLRNRLLRLIGHGRLTDTTKALDDAAGRISRFLLAQSLINAFFGGLLTISLWLAGIPYALLWGFLAAVLRFIPYVGTFIALLLPFVYSVAVFPGWREPLLAIGIYLVLELVTANVIEPLLLGHSTGLSPLALLVAAAFWTWLWGPLGLVLSTPMTTCLAVLGKYVPSLEFLDVLLGNERVLETSVGFYQRLLARDQDEAIDLVEDFLKDHPSEAVYDDLLLPALVYARKDRRNGSLAPEDERFVVEVTRDVLEDLPAPFQGTEEQPSRSECRSPRCLVLACPARDEADETALKMLAKLLEPAGCQVNICSTKMLSAEMVERAEKEQATVICIGTLPPGGVTPARYLCKRLRAALPEAKILVGRWGYKEKASGAAPRLKTAGADFVGETLLETRSQILALLPVVEANQPTPQTEAPRQPVAV